MDLNQYPHRRMRRNRYHPGMRRLVRETKLSADDLIQPLFIKAGLQNPQPIESMPGQVQHSIASGVKAIKKAEQAGLNAVILFGIPAEKDPAGTGAYHKDGIIQKTLRRAKKETNCLIIADLCLCQYTDHGHCGPLKNDEVDNDSSLKILKKGGVSLAEAGADVVAPSGMMDGAVQAIRTALDQNNFQQTAILSYAVKYNSAFYGPFRGAAESAPQSGDRSSYQMDSANRREAKVEARLDEKEGADWLMVKPALPYLDIIRDLREETELPLAAYCVSGEYAMIESAAADGHFDREAAIMESLTSIKRAGADAIISYWATEIAEKI